MSSNQTVHLIDSVPEAMSFLKRFEESSQFLINNLRERGSKVTDDPYSGNFKTIKIENEIVAVFCLARCGNLYAQAVSSAYTDDILESCKSEPFQIKGFLGAWNILSPLYEKYLLGNPSFNPSYKSKEILYRLPSVRKQSPLSNIFPSPNFLG